MATLIQRKGGDIWYVDYYLNGKRVKKSTKTTDRKLAELFLKDLEVKIAKGQFGFEEITHKKIRLSEFTDTYLKQSKATKAWNTTLLDKYALDTFIAYIGYVQLDSIKAYHIEEFKVHSLTTVSPGTVNLRLRHLKAAFQHAVKQGYLKANPCHGVKQIRIKDQNLPRFLTKEEVRRLLDSMPECTFKNLIYFYLYTGCRRNEALKLTWEDIDLDRNRITFYHTKSGKSRMVPFNGTLSSVLKSMQRVGDKPFPFKSDFVTHKFKKYLRNSGIKNYMNFTIHSLRHTYASHLVMEGRDIMTVSKLLGHSSVRITEIYAHLTPDHLKAAVAGLQY